MLALPYGSMTAARNAAGKQQHTRLCSRVFCGATCADVACDRSRNFVLDDATWNANALINVASLLPVAHAITASQWEALIERWPEAPKFLVASLCCERAVGQERDDDNDDDDKDGASDGFLRDDDGDFLLEQYLIGPYFCADDFADDCAIYARRGYKVAHANALHAPQLDALFNSLVSDWLFRVAPQEDDEPITNDATHDDDTNEDAEIPTSKSVYSFPAHKAQESDQEVEANEEGSEMFTAEDAAAGATARERTTKEKEDELRAYFDFDNDSVGDEAAAYQRPNLRDHYSSDEDSSSNAGGGDGGKDDVSDAPVFRRASKRLKKSPQRFR